MTKLKRFLRVIRVQNGENSLQMSQKLNISRTYLSHFENGKQKLTVKFVNMIKKEYNLSTNDEQFLYDCLTEDTNQIVIPVDNIEETHKKLLLSICGELRKADMNKLIEIRGMMSQ